MREIEFRGIDQKDNWQIGTYYFGVMYPTSFQGHYINDVMIDENTIGQYTGLKDKNGKKIFEGDILKHSYMQCNQIRGYSNEVVIYDNKHARFGTKDTHDFFRIKTDIEIIGNIHQDKKLLK